jgi:hypothetical protein
MNHLRAFASPGAVALSIVVFVGGLLHAADAPVDPPGFNPQRHMHVADVQPGMKGYGLTVYHGVTIEPFEVEVVSIQNGFAPGKSTVWIRCPDARMQLSGPVQGMSGSPIFLWPNADPAKPETQVARKLGDGGRMLGAFAFGHRLGKDCYAGVQPIEQMLAAADRGHRQKEEDRLSAGAASMTGQLTAALKLARQFNMTPEQTWRLRAICDLTRTPALPADFNPDADSAAAGPLDSAHHLALPVAVSSAEQAAMLRPFLADAGLVAVAGGTGASSPPPPGWIDAKSVKLVPGSVFAVPLAFGPMDLAAVGTTTEVLPDGTVLAFGHQFFAQGPIAVPMATGYVHFVQPNIQSSFKLGSSLVVQGALIRDEAVAVIGRPGATYPTADVNIHVRFPEATQNKDFTYKVVHHDQVMPGIIGTVAAQSMSSDTGPPRLSTLTLSATLKFDNGRTLQVEQIMPGGNPQQLMLGMVSPIPVLTENPFASAMLQSVDATVTIEKGIRAADLLDATLEQSTVKPGEEVVINVRLQPYGQKTQLKRITIKVPDDARDGSYALLVGGSQAFHTAMLAMRPYLQTANNANELFDSVQQVVNLKDDALYTVLRLLPANNLAIGRSELPRLPSSRAALLAAENSTRTTQFVDSVNRVDPMPYVVMGQLSLQVTVAQDPTKAP